MEGQAGCGVRRQQHSIGTKPGERHEPTGGRDRRPRQLQFIFNCEIEAFPAPGEQILDAIERHDGQLPRDEVTESLAQFVDVAIDWPTEAAERPVARLVNLLFQEAVGLHAAEVRLEPQADHVLVLYRIDGEMVERDRLPRRLLSPVAARFRVMAGLDPAVDQETRTGRIRLGFSGDVRAFAIAITPTGLGPRIVLAV